MHARWLPPSGCALAFLALALHAGPAGADLGAFSVEALPAISVSSVKLPIALGSATQTGSALSLNLAGHYALSNNLEVGAVTFFEPGTNWVHAGAAYQQFSGSLTSRASRVGALADVRLVGGLVWRASAGVGLGFSRRAFSQLDLYDVSGPTPRSFGLSIGDAALTNFVVAPTIGLRWTGDHAAFGIEPRFEVLVGQGASWAVTVPLSFAWSWYP